MELSEFLLARIADDEEAARECAKVYPAPWECSDRGWVAYVRADEPNFHEVARLEQEHVERGTVEWLGDALAHVARWDPARVLAECEAKRRIVEWHQRSVHVLDRGVVIGRAIEASRADESRAILYLLALPYANHPDYDEEWKP